MGPSGAMERRPIAELVEAIAETCEPGRRLQFMEVCGTHTVSLFRSGVRSLLPAAMRLVSGPGCPVCVTSQGYVDTACELAGTEGVTICTYGDMVRVPGQRGSLEQCRATGAEVVVVYSARDALFLAQRRPDRQVVFLAVGFETTAPATAATVLEARQAGVGNFSVLAGHKLVIPAMESLLSAGDIPIDGFLCPGHVSVVIGADAYLPIAEGHGKPCVVAGFEAANMLEAILRLARQVSRGEARVENVYGVAVTPGGNPAAVALVERVFVPAATAWRAMGVLPDSGLDLREEFQSYDAVERFGVEIGPDVAPPGCRCGDVIQGRLNPPACPLFGTGCTPVRPVGPCMVSGEGSCAAWYRYGRGNRDGGADR